METQLPDYNDHETRHASHLAGLEAQNSELATALQARERQIESLRSDLLNPQHSGPGALDDNKIAARFASVDQNIKDWIINHFSSGEQRIAPSPELREILIAQVPMFDRLLQQTKTKTLVLRAVVASILQRAFDNGEFLGVGLGLSALEGTMENNSMILAPERGINPPSI
jgi:hypothetical protein